jgi:hypothetical protein
MSNKFTVHYILNNFNLDDKNRVGSNDNLAKTSSKNSQNQNKLKNSVIGSNSNIQPTNVTYKKADKSSNLKLFVIL